MRSLQLDPIWLGKLELHLAGALPDFSIETDEPLILRDPENKQIAIYRPGDPFPEIETIEEPTHPDFKELRHKPGEFRPHAAMALSGFLTEESEEALKKYAPSVLHILQFAPIDHFARVRAAMAAVDPASTSINILPLSPTDFANVVDAMRGFGAQQMLGALGDTYSPAVKAIMDEYIPPKEKQGFCVWFTGLPSSGKSTVAKQVSVLLRERGRQVSMLDGDVVRMHLSKGLGFTREDRDTNIQRIGFVAGEIVKHHGVAICAAVSPYQRSRDEARRMVGDNFILVHVATPPEVCEERDVKGFYKKARAGAMQGMTGVDDPYEDPTNAEITLATTGVTAEENAAAVLTYLKDRGFVGQ